MLEGGSIVFASETQRLHDGKTIDIETFKRNVAAQTAPLSSKHPINETVSIVFLYGVALLPLSGWV